jgi:lysyl-tRNA synthetase class 2
MNIEKYNLNFEEGQLVDVAGRVTLIRSFGKLTFLTLQENEYTIQIGLRGKMILPQHWDIIKVKGEMRYTKTGEPTIWSDSYELIAKCENNIPNKVDGLLDKGQIYEDRCAYFISQKEEMKTIMRRSKYISDIRLLLYNERYTEIETPILSNSPTGANATPFKTHYNAKSEDRFLRIATETSLKKAIICGVDRVYEIGKIFRNEGVDWSHNPEFTSIEIYTAYENLQYSKKLFLDILSTLKNYEETEYDEFEYDDLLNKYGEDFDKHLQKLTFVYGQPIEQTPLCKQRADGKADRFEVFANGYELANAYNEIVDAKEQESRMNIGEDDGLIHAMRYGMPQTTGIGIGIDRLIMYLENKNNIKDTIFIT